MSDNSNVLYLAYSSPETVSDAMDFTACACCHNKTFTVTHDRVQDFPLLRCAACGNHIGRIGWANDDDPLVSADGAR